MYSTVLLPTDGSEGAGEATETALEAAERFDAAVHALYVIDERTITEHYDMVREEAEREAERALDRVAERGTEHGISVERHLRQGVPHEQIVDAIDDYGVDLVVMGTNGRTGLDRVLHLGSTTERVVRSTPVEVLTVPI